MQEENWNMFRVRSVLNIQQCSVNRITMEHIRNMFRVRSVANILQCSVNKITERTRNMFRVRSVANIHRGTHAEHVPCAFRGKYSIE